MTYDANDERSHDDDLILAFAIGSRSLSLCKQPQATTNCWIIMNEDTDGPVGNVLCMNNLQTLNAFAFSCMDES